MTSPQRNRSGTPSLMTRNPPTTLTKGWTMPKGPLESFCTNRSPSPACTKYSPNFGALEPKHRQARFIPRGSIQLGKADLSDPGSAVPRPLPPPKTFFSKLPKDTSTFLGRRSASPDFIMKPPGIGDAPIKGGTIAKGQRYAPIPGVASAAPLDAPHRNPATGLTPSILDVPLSHIIPGVSISKTPLPRGEGTKHRPSLDSGAKFSAFDRCAVPQLSFVAARQASRSVLLDGDDYAAVDDPKLRDDLKFLQVVREDMERWKLKSALH